jgi:hypothetical protein
MPDPVEEAVEVLKSLQKLKERGYMDGYIDGINASFVLVIGMSGLGFIAGLALGSLIF